MRLFIKVCICPSEIHMRVLCASPYKYVYISTNLPVYLSTRIFSSYRSARLVYPVHLCITNLSAPRVYSYLYMMYLSTHPSLLLSSTIPCNSDVSIPIVPMISVQYYHFPITPWQNGSPHLYAWRQAFETIYSPLKSAKV